MLQARAVHLQVCGQGQDVDGDAVVPNCSAFLQVRLPGCNIEPDL